MKSHTRRLHVEAVRRALRRLRAGPASLAELSTTVGMAPHHFHRTFTAVTGRTLAAHVRTVRLARAARALRDSDATVADIADSAGYGCEDTFRRAFRKRYASAPREYRLASRNENQPSASELRQIQTVRRIHDRSNLMNGPLHGATIGLVKIPVRDFERSRRFYREALGLTEEFAVEAYGWAQYACGAVPLCIYVAGMGGGAGEPVGETGIQLRVSDARRTASSVSQHVVGDVAEGDDGSVGFSLSDPDGNLIHVLEVG